MTGQLLLLAAVASCPWWVPARPGRFPRSSPHVPAPRAVDAAVLLDLAGAALAAGVPVPAMLHGLGKALAPARLGTELQRVGTLLMLGADWAEAWAATPVALDWLRDALEPAWTHGTDPAPLLRHGAAAVRANRARADQEAAGRLGTRLVLPLGLCYLPAFVLLGIVPALVSAGAGLLGG